MEKQSEGCAVDGALALSLGASRFLGIAPVWFSRRYDEWHIRTSSAVHFYGYLLILALDACLLAGLVRDLWLDAEHAVCCIVPTTCMVWLTLTFFIFLVSNVGIYGAKKRINTIIDGFNLISKIPCKPKQDSFQEERKQYILYAVFLVTTLLVSCAAFFFMTYTNLSNNKDSFVSYLYHSYIIMVFIELLLESQFIFFATKIIFALKYINVCLENMLRIDVFKLHHTTKAAKETVTPLVVSYCTLCDVIDQLDGSSGLSLLIILASSIVQVLASSYFILSIMYTTQYLFIFVEIVYFIIHIINMVVLVEPGHRTLDEMESTKILLSQLQRRAPSPTDPLAVELDKFMMQTTLNQVSYSPLGICTLTRSLVATMLGAVITYLVVILQFQTLDQ